MIKRGSFRSFLAAHAFQVGLPALAVRRIREHEVELHGRKGVRREGRAELDVVGGGAFAFQQQVGLADGVGFGVDLLAEQMNGDVFAVFPGQLVQGFLGHCEHAASAAGAVVNPVSGIENSVGHGLEDQVGHKPHYIPGREVLAGLFVVFLVEPADQLLENRAHGVVVQAGQADIPVLVVNRVGAEVNIVGGELLDEAAQNFSIDKRLDLIAELELVQYLLDVSRKAFKVGFEVGPELVLLGPGSQVPEGERGNVIEGVP